MNKDFKIIDFDTMGNIGMSSIQYSNIEDEKEEIVNTIVTSCLDEEELEERLESKSYCDGIIIVGLSNEENKRCVAIERIYNPISGNIWSLPVATTKDSESIEEVVVKNLDKNGLATSVDNVSIQKPTYSNITMTDQKVSVAFAECTESDLFKENKKLNFITLDEVEDLLKSDSEISTSTRLILTILCLANGDMSKINRYL